MCEILLDVDVVIKLTAYDLLDKIAHPGCETPCEQRAGVTAATRYVATSQLKRRAADPKVAIARLEGYLDVASILEPTQEEIEFAARLESAATRQDLELGTGESQICAIAIFRAVPAILTGDKRAIATAELLLHSVPQLSQLAARVACLEQAVQLTVERIGAATVRNHVLAERNMDTALGVCFEATRVSVPANFEPVGLASYISSMRVTAPTLLMSGDSLHLRSVT